MGDREQALDRERERRSRSEAAHQTERKWRQELHAEISRTYRERGSLGDPSDVPSMVLRLTRSLLDAQKGLLLWRRDEDAGGELALAAAEGFEHSPEDSAIARRFAEEALERDQTVREGNPGEEDDRRTEADEEIENLIAVPIYLQDEFSGVVVCANNPDGFDDYDDEVLPSVGDQAGMVLQNEQLREELRAAYLTTVGVLADTIEVKDPFLRGHSEEVASYVAAVAERLELPPRSREELLFGSLLHDIGKIGVSERVLLKPSALTAEEFEAIELHPRIGYRLIQQVSALKPLAPAILYHHERFDGAGYPSGLRGEDIPLEARIICVADSFSAMIADRPYRERMTLDEACAELERCSGTQFDPEVVRVFVEEVRRRPPTSGWSAPALEDPELELWRTGEEPIVGDGTIALTDNLTLLYTRRYFHEIVQAEAGGGAGTPLQRGAHRAGGDRRAQPARATPPGPGDTGGGPSRPTRRGAPRRDGLPLRRPPPRPDLPGRRRAGRHATHLRDLGGHRGRLAGARRGRDLASQRYRGLRARTRPRPLGLSRSASQLLLGTRARILPRGGAPSSGPRGRCLMAGAEAGASALADELTADRFNGRTTF